MLSFLLLPIKVFKREDSKYVLECNRISNYNLKINDNTKKHFLTKPNL